MKKDVVLVLNPGSTSTKVALFDRDEPVFSETIRHSQTELDQFQGIADQLEYRFQIIHDRIINICKEQDFRIIGIAGRGGIVRPLEGGIYRINNRFLKDAMSGKYGEHASNLGSLLADRFRNERKLKDCYTVDPVSSTRMYPKAQISGVPSIKRVGRGHPLNMRMTARKIAEKQGIKLEDSHYVIAHLGGGISVGLVEGGYITDINDALLGMGPFSPNRAGALPIRGVIKLCQKMSEEEVYEVLSKNSGLKAYLGTEDVREVLRMKKEGNRKAKLIYDAFIYQISKEIGAYFAASECQAQAIILTGGIAHNETVTNDIKSYVGRLTDFFVYPGENEMEALADGVFRVLTGEEEAIDY